MSCCAPAVELPDATIDRRTVNDELLLASRDIGEGLRQTDLSVPTIHCGGCIQKIEQSAWCPAGRRAGAGQSLGQAGDDPLARRQHAAPFIETLRRIGYEAHLYDSALDPKDGVGGTGSGTRRCRLRGEQYHAAVGVDLVRRGS